MAYDRIYNFSAGPSMLPEEVLLKAQAELLNCGGSGESVTEMSHRSKVFEAILADAEAGMREVMAIPDNYKVLFLQGGASLQFAMIPMNLMTINNKADYILTGQFSTKAYDEALKYGTINVAGSTKSENFSRIPRQEELELDPEADYVHICYNNTIFGTTWDYIPDTGDVPLVADISSFIMSAPLDISKFGLVYAGAQKNLAPAGLTVVIIREDLLNRKPMPLTPVMCNYAVMAKNNSMYNTPPCFPIYICKLVIDWIKELGGLEVMKERNEKKAKLLYDYLDQSKLFKGTAAKECRSAMNVTFRTPSEELDKQFVKFTADNGMDNLNGHRSVGGMRASIYNAMPYEGVVKLVELMRQFEAQNA